MLNYKRHSILLTDVIHCITAITADTAALIPRQTICLGHDRQQDVLGVLAVVSAHHEVRDRLVILGGNVENIRDDLLLLLQRSSHLFVFPTQLLDLVIQRLDF